MSNIHVAAVLKAAFAGLMMVAAHGAIGQDAPPEPGEEDFEAAREEGVEAGRRALYGSRMPDVSDPLEDGVTHPDHADSDKLYLEHMIPGYTTERHQRWMESMETALENPADLGILAEQHNQSLEQGDSAVAEAWRAVREAQRAERVSLRDSDGGVDDLLQESAAILNLNHAAYDEILGDCTRVTQTLFETQTTKLNETKTCNQLFAPQPGEFTCTGQRAVQFAAVGTQRIALFEAVVAESNCEEVRDEVVLECRQTRCDDVWEMEFQICAATCEEGDDECENACLDHASNARQQCRAAANPCEALWESTLNQCLAEGGEFADCQTQADGARDECEGTCDAVGDDAFAQCEADLVIGGPGEFVGTTVLSADSIQRPHGSVPCSGTGNGLVEFACTADPFVIPETSEPEYFTAHHQLVMPGGTGVVTSWGGVPVFRTEIAATGTAGSPITTVELWATLYRVVQNDLIGCEEYMDTIADNFCSGELACTAGGGACVVIDGVELCETAPSAGALQILRPWHSQAAPPGSLEELAPRTCMAVTSEPLDCHFYLGEGNCYEGASGNQYCIEGLGDNLQANLGPPPFLDDCAQLLATPGCVQQENVCVEGGEGEVTGRCYVRDQRFQCAVEELTREVPTQRRELVSCDSEIRCLGTDCVNIQPETNNEFESIVQHSALQDHMQSDAACIGYDKDEDLPPTGPCNWGDNVEPDPTCQARPTDCRPGYFEGRSFECKIPIGSDEEATPNCCELGLQAHSETTYEEYMEVSAALQNASSEPHRARTQSQESEATGHQGSLITPPDPQQIRQDTDWGTVDPETGQRVVQSDPDNLSPASDDEANYVGRPTRTPFESTSARYGVVIETEEESDERKQQAQRTHGEQSYGSYLGKGAQDVLAARGYDTQSGFTADGTYYNADVTPARQINESYRGQKLSQSITGGNAFQCEAEESELGALRRARACTYVGKYCNETVGAGPLKTCVETREVYCCFNTALAREFHEKMKQGEDDPFGTAKNPDCRGFEAWEIRQMAEQDYGGWINPDSEHTGLNEWYAMAHQSNLVPAARPQDDRWEAENVAPQRVVAGRKHTGGHGGDGMVPADERILGMVAANAESMEAATHVLSQRDRTRHDPELMPWYVATTANEDPQYSDDPDIGDDWGTDPDPEWTNPCEGWPAHGMSQSFTYRPPPDYLTSPSGNFWFNPPLSTSETYGVVATGNADQFFSLRFSLPPGAGGIGLEAGAFSGPEYRPSVVRVVVSSCPGDISILDKEYSCFRDVPIVANDWPHTTHISLSTIDSADACSVEPNRDYYVNIAARAGIEGEYSGCEHSYCEMLIFWDWSPEWPW